MHSHTFSGNALAAAIALECFAILEDEKIIKQVNEKEIILRKFMEEVNQKTHRLVNIRGIGAIVAADLALKENEKNQRIGYRIFQHALDLGAWLRPLGNTIYWLPPLNITLSTLEELRDITTLSIKRVFNKKIDLKIKN